MQCLCVVSSAARARLRSRGSASWDGPPPKECAPFLGVGAHPDSVEWAVVTVCGAIIGSDYCTGSAGPVKCLLLDRDAVTEKSNAVGIHRMPLSFSVISPLVSDKVFLHGRM